MFSGIIKETSYAKLIKRNKNSMSVMFLIPSGWKLTLGESVNVDGVCSTVNALSKTSFGVYYMPETLDKTNLSKADKPHIFNLERCLTLNDLISGHLVYGHVDTVAQVETIKQVEDSIIINFSLSSKFTKYLVYKGSVAVNGVSLTVVEVTKNSFTVSLIPHTLDNTNLGQLKIGDLVNIEVDMLAKHIEKLLKKA
jgi:riboflavin synthase